MDGDILHLDIFGLELPAKTSTMKGGTYVISETKGIII